MVVRSCEDDDDNDEEEEIGRDFVSASSPKVGIVNGATTAAMKMRMMPKMHAYDLPKTYIFKHNVGIQRYSTPHIEMEISLFMHPSKPEACGILRAYTYDSVYHLSRIYMEQRRITGSTTCNLK